MVVVVVLDATIRDALTVVAGLLREPLWSFVILVTVAKTGRYLILAAATLGTMAVLGFEVSMTNGEGTFF